MEKSVKVYDREIFSQLIVDVKVVRIHKIEEAIKDKQDTQIPKEEDLNISNTLTCSYCKVTFEDNLHQRQHYKSDWHRYNLKLNLKSLEPLSEDKFDQLADDVSSISGSDTESEDNSEKGNINALYQGKIYFKNGIGNIFSMYRALLHEKKDAPENDETLLKIVKQLSRNTYWTIFMLGGGHFAGAVFDGNNIVAHKTFHCYTVRAKQGGSQSTKDNKSGGFKSAGSSLRRYNEQSLVQHIGDLLETWNKEIDKSILIFYHAAGTYNRTVLFGGKTPILKKGDSRLRSIPFSTKRPTFTEIKRVHEVLSTLEVYTSIETIKSQFALKTNEEEAARLARKETREAQKIKTNINRAKSRESKESTRPVPGEDISSSETENENEDFELSTENLELSFEGLQEFGDTIPEALKKKKIVKKKKPKRKDRTKKWEESLKRNLYNASSKGDLEELKNVLNGIKVEEGNELTPDKAVNLALDEHGNTVLHLAAMKSLPELIIWLMENNSSPCNKNDKFQTPYIVNADKGIRNVFREFALANPDKYNYPKAQIPVIIPTMTAEEQADKKRAQRKVKREKEKEKRKEQDIKKKDDEDRSRFLKLSDREKMALAAERRMLAAKAVILVRCFLCGEDMSGKVPFEYSGNRFCSITCLKAHRMQKPLVLS